MSFQSLDSLQGNAHNDDNRGTADGQVTDTFHQVACYDGQQSDDTQINGTKDNDLVDNLLNKFCGGLAGTEAGNETAVLLQVVGEPRRSALMSSFLLLLRLNQALHGQNPVC